MEISQHQVASSTSHLNCCEWNYAQTYGASKSGQAYAENGVIQGYDKGSKVFVNQRGNIMCPVQEALPPEFFVEDSPLRENALNEQLRRSQEGVPPSSVIFKRIYMELEATEARCCEDISILGTDRVFIGHACPPGWEETVYSCDTYAYTYPIYYCTLPCQQGIDPAVPNACLNEESGEGDDGDFVE